MQQLFLSIGHRQGKNKRDGSTVTVLKTEKGNCHFFGALLQWGRCAGKLLNVSLHFLDRISFENSKD